jgi:osmotically inducible protein OsmC
MEEEHGMAIRTSDAEWRGDLRQGRGTMRLGSGAFEGAYSFPSRFEEGAGTNPEELIAAAHAGCFSMALAAGLSRAGHVPTRIHTRARVHLERQGEGFAITRIELETEGHVPGLDAAGFQAQAEAAKKNCPVSRALAGPAISLTATLVGA